MGANHRGMRSGGTGQTALQMGEREDDGDKSLECITGARKAMFAFQRPTRPCDALRGPELNTGIGESMWV